MTKLKNTKKGMAKKALSISLVAAMLATSNVPVWAAEFTDGTDAVVEAPVVEEFAAEAPVEEVAPETTDLKAVAATLTAESDGIVGDKIKDNTTKVTFKTNAKTDAATGYSLNWYITDSPLKVDLGANYTDVNGGKDFDNKNFESEADETLVSADAAFDGLTVGKHLVCVLYTRTKNTGNWIVAAVSPSFEIVGDSVEDYVTSVEKTVEWGSKLPNVTPTLNNGATIDEAKWYKDGIAVAADYETTQTDINSTFEYKATLTNTPFSGQEVVLATCTVTGKQTSAVANIKWSGFDKEVTSGATLECDYDGNAHQLTIDNFTTKEGEKVSNEKFQYTYKRGGKETTDFTSAGTIAVTAEVVESGVLAQGTKLTVNLNIKGIDVSKNTNVTLNPVKYLKSGSYLSFSGTEDAIAEAVKEAGLVVENNGKTLKYGTDYTTKAVTLKNEVGTEKITLTVTGKGNYTGTYAKKVDIVAAELADAKIDDIAPKQYTGNRVEPAVTVKLGSDTLVKDTDYTVEYSNNVNPSKDALVTVTGKGNYTGTITKTFEIKSISLSELKKQIETESAFTAGVTYTGKAIDPIKDSYAYQGVNAVWMKGRDFEVKYTPQNTNAGTVKATVTGINNYSGESFELEFKINPVSLRDTNVKVDLSSVIYSPDLEKRKDEIKSGLKLTYKDMTLVEKADFTIDSVSVSGKKVTLTLTGIKNFKDTLTVSANVTAKDINDITLPKIDAQKYTGYEIKASIDTNGKLKLTSNNKDLVKDLELKDGTTLLTGNDYYIVNQVNNTKVGTATINLAGKGNYTGKVALSFPIVDAELTGTIVDKTTKSTILDDQEYSYETASTIKGITYPGLIVMDEKGNDITGKCDITYTDNKAVGTATITATGKDGFKFNAVNTFKITPAKLSGTLTLKKDTFDYTGEEIKPEYTFEAKDGKYTLVEGTDYKVEYVNNVNAATASESNTTKRPAVKVTGLGNYAGKDANGKEISVVEYFTIKAVELSASDIYASDVAFAGGIPVKPAVTITNPKSGKALVEGTDYTVEITKGGTKVGPAEAEIKLTEAGKKNYTLSDAIKTVKFNVTPFSLNNASVNAIEDQVVTGSQIKPAVVVMNGDVRLVEGYDYEVVYGENTAVGEGTVTIKALSSNKDYTGSKTVTFNIVDEKPEVGKAVIKDVIVTGNTVRPVLEGDVDGATGYDFVISTVENTQDGRVAISKNVLSTDTRFYYVGEGSYYVYCHAWKKVNGKKVFGAWSNIESFEVTATTPATPKITSVKRSGNNITVTYTKCAGATGYDVVLGSAQKKVNGELRPTNYGKAVKKVYNKNTVSVTFKNCAKGTYYAGLHAYNRTSECL